MPGTIITSRVSNMGGGGGGAARKATPEEIAAARANSLEGRRAAVDSRIAQLYSMLEAQESGRDAPFTQAIINSLLAQEADRGASAYQTQQRQIQRGFNRFGAGGSGGEIAALAQAARGTAAQTGAGQRDVGIRTGVENYGARERGRSQLGNLLGQLMQWNSRFELTGESPLGNALRGQPTGGGGYDPLAAALVRMNRTGSSGFNTGWTGDEGGGSPYWGWTGAGVTTTGADAKAKADAQRNAYYASTAGLGDYGKGGRAGALGSGYQNYGDGYLNNFYGAGYQPGPAPAPTPQPSPYSYPTMSNGTPIAERPWEQPRKR